MRTQVKAHEVHALRIESIHPLVAGGKMLSPEVGLLLVLSDETKHQWFSEKDGVTPSVGDWLIHDGELKSTYVVSSTQFKTLFQEANDAAKDFTSIGGKKVGHPVPVKAAKEISFDHLGGKCVRHPSDHPTADKSDESK